MSYRERRKTTGFATKGRGRGRRVYPLTSRKGDMCVASALSPVVVSPQTINTNSDTIKSEGKQMITREHYTLKETQPNGVCITVIDGGSLEEINQAKKRFEQADEEENRFFPQRPRSVYTVSKEIITERSDPIPDPSTDTSKNEYRFRSEKRREKVEEEPRVTAWFNEG